LQGEKKGDIRFAGPDEDKLNVSEEEDSQLKAIESASEPTEELISITKAENERKTKADMDLLEAIKGIETAGGGALSDIASAASSIGGKKAGVGMLAKAGTFLAGNAGAITGGASILAGGVAAYKGYSDYNEADEQVKSGAITEDEGDIKKTGAVGTGVGGIGGALAGGQAGAAIGTLIFPISLIKGSISKLPLQNNCKSFNVPSPTLSNFVDSLIKFKNNFFFSIGSKVFVLHFSAIK
jgi:hypothetical protein